jgi:Zn-dependent protease with chaperone function
VSHSIRTEWLQVYKNKDSYIAAQRDVVGANEHYDAKHNLSCIVWRVALAKDITGDLPQWQEQFASLAVLTDAAIATGKAMTEGLESGPPSYYAVRRSDMPLLHEMVDSIATQFGIQPPLITIADHMDLKNAYVVQSAQSAGLQQSLLVIGTGFLDLANDSELEGILAHECAHVAQKHPVQKVTFLHTVPAYINTFYEWMPWVLVAGLLALGLSKEIKAVGLIGLAAYLAKPFALRFLARKKVSQSVAIELEADQCAAVVDEKTVKNLLHGLEKLHDHEEQQIARREQGFAALREFVEKDDAIAVRVRNALIRFVVTMHNSTRAISAQKAAYYPPLTQRIEMLKARPKKPLA